jgi:hypothetical protein
MEVGKAPPGGVVFFYPNGKVQFDLFSQIWYDIRKILEGGASVEAFTMEIADLAVGVKPLFQSTKEYCRPYLTDKEPELTVQITGEDLAYEQEMLDREAAENGLKRRKFTDPFLERTSIQRQVADYLVGRNTLLLHGSTVAVDGNAYLFTAPCGTGKSTHTRLWRELFGERAVMVNDDKPFLQITAAEVLAYGSPWSGKHGLANNVCVPLKGICLLHRGTENVIRQAEKQDLAETLCKQVHLPENEVLATKVLALVDTLAERIPLWEMACNKELEAAKVAYAAMNRQGK